MAQGGFALLRATDTTARLVRLNDGVMWSVMGSTDTPFQKSMWVDDQYVWLSVTSLTIPHAAPRETGVVRYRRDSLGAPVPAK